MRLLQRGVLPLELALRFLPGRALVLEGSLGLLEDGLLLLELSLRLLACALLLAELLPHRNKQGDLIRQISPQPLSLLGFLLSLGLLGPSSLEGGAILLELSLYRGEGRLSPPSRSAPQPGPHAPSAMPGPALGVQLSPCQPPKLPSWFGHPGPGVHPTRLAAGTPEGSDGD
jgi:hypothetical protein